MIRRPLHKLHPCFEGPRTSETGGRPARSSACGGVAGGLALRHISAFQSNFLSLKT